MVGDGDSDGDGEGDSAMRVDCCKSSMGDCDCELQ